jgi:hypothetical protein
VHALRLALKSGSTRKLATFSIGELSVEVARTTDSLWLLIRRPRRGGLALRAAWVPEGAFECRRLEPMPDDTLRFEIESALGRHVVRIVARDGDLPTLRLQTSLEPAAPLLVPFLPRDLYPLGRDDDPLAAGGNVEAAQRGMNAGLLYFTMKEPKFGSVFYFQNLTSLNDYYRATSTKPDGAVGGEWPELGYLPPTPPQSGTPPTHPLPAGKKAMMSDAVLVFRDIAAKTEQELARHFLQMLGLAYRSIELPESEYRDWVWRAEQTLADLQHAPQATERHFGHRYAKPYVDGEVPDAMVQLSLVAALHEYGKWLGEPTSLEGAFRKGVEKFYDPKVGTLRRFLPGVDGGKDPDAVDSWYLYHPLINLARLALDGDDEARDLLLKSADYGIKAAHHFKYRWPIEYKIGDFSLITAARDERGFGQTDVNGLYAYLMMQLYQLTSEQHYLQEARAAIEAAKGLRFDLLYQTNISVWGAVACMRLWRITADKDYLDQSYVYLAGFFHNCEIWESQIGHAVHYKNFLGATCLHDAPYMAMYECFECFLGLEEYLTESGPELDPAVRMLTSEYCKYALDRGWFYFPDVLPKEILHEGEHQSGIINRKLSFPLEDLYGDGQAPGQIGQEIYGAGGAFLFASRSHHHLEGAPFQLFCNQFLQGCERTGERSYALFLAGGETCQADLSLVRLKRHKLPKVTLATAGGDILRPRSSSGDRIDYRVPAHGRLVLQWK